MIPTFLLWHGYWSSKKQRVISKWEMKSHDGRNGSTVTRRGGDWFDGVDGNGNFDPEREGEKVMLLTILIVVIMLGLVMPLFWIIGTIGSITYVGLNRKGVARKERTVVLNPQLGFTMADGGEPVDEGTTESAAVKQAGMTETSQGSPEQVTRKPIRDKMFWWGGYY
jgi:hypothetical protein